MFFRNNLKTSEFKQQTFYSIGVRFFDSQHRCYDVETQHFQYQSLQSTKQSYFAKPTVYQ